MLIYSRFYEAAWTEPTFLLAGLRYHETTVKVISSIDGNISPKGSPIVTCETNAPDATKKNPAYAHSFTTGNFGASIAMTPNIFQMPNIVSKYAG